MVNKVQIQVVTWNSFKHLERLFRGIQNQYEVEYSILIIDNNSTDGTVELLENIRHSEPVSESTSSKNKILKQVQNDVGIAIIKNQKNLGFAKAHNQGFEICEAPYVLVLNPDTELQEGFLREVVNIIDADEKIASAGGILFQRLPTNEKSGIIDSCGLQMKINGQIVDIKQNTLYKAKSSLKTDVFGVSGACALYRLNAIKQVKDKYGIFDERFGSYKEDADLAWRLNRAGFKAKICAQAFSWHAREAGKGDRANRSNRIKQLSIRNHILMLKKNLGLRDLYRMPIILGYELAKFAYIFLFEKENLKAYKSTRHSDRRESLNEVEESRPKTLERDSRDPSIRQ